MTGETDGDLIVECKSESDCYHVNQRVDDMKSRSLDDEWDGKVLWQWLQLSIFSIFLSMSVCLCVCVYVFRASVSKS